MTINLLESSRVDMKKIIVSFALIFTASGQASAGLLDNLGGALERMFQDKDACTYSGIGLPPRNTYHQTDFNKTPTIEAFCQQFYDANPKYSYCLESCINLSGRDFNIEGESFYRAKANSERKQKEAEERARQVAARKNLGDLTVKNAAKIASLGFSSAQLKSMIYIRRDLVNPYQEFMPLEQLLAKTFELDKVTKITAIESGKNKGVLLKSQGTPSFGFLFRFDDGEAFLSHAVDGDKATRLRSSDEEMGAGLMLLMLALGGEREAVNRASAELAIAPQAPTSPPKIASGESGDAALEMALIKGMQINPSTMQRVETDSGKAIRAYMKDGYINKKPNTRADYTDYYLLNQPATFMGHKLLVIEEEYMAAYIGCCVSPGLGVSVQLMGSSANLEKFAKENGCGFDLSKDLKADLRNKGLSTQFLAGQYATLSCRERNAEGML